MENVTESAIFTALNALGHSPARVASALQRRNIRGRSDCFACPIANYLTRRFTGATFVVNIDSIKVIKEKSTVVSSARISNVISKFIRKFDEGSYEFLRD